MLGVLPREAADFVKFHVETIECRLCAASIADLRAQQSAAESETVTKRRQRYFQSSAGYLRKK